MSHTAMDGKRITCTVASNFVCNTCGTSQATRKLLCHPLPSVYRSQEVAGAMLKEKSSRLSTGILGPKSSAPLAVRTFGVDDFAFGAVSTTFTLEVPPLPNHHPLSSSPESANSGSLQEGNTGSGHWSSMEEEERHSVHFPPSSNISRPRREKLGLQGADSASGLESVKRGELFTFRQTRNWLKKQTSSATVFTQIGGKKLHGVAAPAYAHINESTKSDAKATPSLGRPSERCQSQLAIQEDLDEDMRRILDQLQANIKLEA